jgi:cell division protein FtsN
MRKYLREKSSVFYIGKGVIILSLVITSSLSFILGFFVGKGMRSPGIGQASVVTPLINTGQEKRGTEMKEVPSQQTVRTSETQKAPETPEIPKKENPQESPEIKKPQQSRETEHNGESRQVKEDEKTSKAKESKNSRETRDPEAKVKYMVQIGAFKNASDADSLKSKFSKKGYKSFIIVSKRERDEKLYKVLIGEFRNKKEADLLSVKIRKTEGLKAFITFKTD